MTIYLIISCITLCLCRITYVWVKHKKRKQREVALADELIEDENGIIVTVSTTTAQTIGRSNHNRDFFIPLREDKEDFTPKKRMKVHKIDQGIRKETFVSPILSYGKWGDNR